MSREPRAVVVGAGAGGAAAARRLQGRFQVTVLEQGREFRPLALSRGAMVRLRNWGLLLDEREIGLVFPAMRVRRTAEGMVIVNGRGTGGTTALCTGNALRADEALRRIGIDLDEEFEELTRVLPISSAHQERWRPVTRRLFEICGRMGLDPRPTPKLIDPGRCRQCGRCVLGCPHGARWDSRRFLAEAVGRGATLVTGCRARRVVIGEDGRVRGVLAGRGGGRVFYPADLVVLAAGGLGTPPILERSGIPCQPRLFVDPVLCVAGLRQGSGQDREIPMPFVVRRDRYLLSPYFDLLSFLFDRRWRHPPGDVVSMMIKLADDGAGSVRGTRVDKTLTAADRAGLEQAVAECREILARCGIDRESLFLGTLNAGHPGGMLPLGPGDAATLHPAPLPPGLYVADATLLPESPGGPPILTIMALAGRVARLAAASG